jgi:hypothetical protein
MHEDDYTSKRDGRTGDQPVENYIMLAGLPPPRPDLADRRGRYSREFWNAAGNVGGINCYGYALNIPEWIHIGELAMRPRPHTVSALFNLVVGDGLHPAPLRDPPDIEGYYLVALVSGQGWHWYRKDSARNWSHKDGSDPVTDLDASGFRIRDPRTADRGPYRHFEGYFYVPHVGLEY